jgi:hypothetical protein
MFPNVLKNLSAIGCADFELEAQSPSNSKSLFGIIQQLTAE